MAALRLIHTKPGGSTDDDPLVSEAVALALTGGAAVRPEARLWAALLTCCTVAAAAKKGCAWQARSSPSWKPARSPARPPASGVCCSPSTPASRRHRPGPAATRHNDHHQPARAARRRPGRPARHKRSPRRHPPVQITFLQAELTHTPAAADSDLLRLHHALATGYATLGDYRHALHQAEQELPLRRSLQGDDHPDTLATRANIAFWTGQVGDPAAALRLSRELLPTWCGCSARPTRTSWPPVPTSPSVPESAAISRPRCGGTWSCCPTWCGCYARPTPTPWPPAPT